MSIIYPNGAGDTLGDQLVTCKPLYSTGSIWYVNSSGGVDAASPAGKNREAPLATLAQAITNAADNDIVELMSGHTESPAAPWVVNKKLIIVGGGSSGGKPTVKLGSTSAGGNRFTVTATNVELRNIWFTQCTGVAALGVVVSAALFRMKNCYYELGSKDSDGIELFTGADSARIVNTTFISVATSAAALPGDAIRLTGAAVSDLELDGVTFSAGLFGFSNPAAFSDNGIIINRLKAENVSLLLGADVNLATAGKSGFFNPQVSTGGARADF